MFSQVRVGLTFIAFLLLFGGILVSAGELRASVDPAYTIDSIKNPSLLTTKELAAIGLKQSALNFREHQVALRQSRIFIRLKNEIEKARNFLGKGFDYYATRHEITQLIKWKELAIDGVTVHNDSIQTVRNLSTTATLLTELLNRTNNRLSQIITYHSALGKMQHVLDSLAMDSVLYQVPDDSVAMMNYSQSLRFLTRDIVPVNLELKSSLNSIQKLIIQVNLFKFDLESEMSKTEFLRIKLFTQFNTNEFSDLGQKVDNEKPVGAIIAYSLEKAKLVLLFYVVNHFGMMVLMLLCMVGIYFYLAMLRYKVKKEKVQQELVGREIVLQKPLVLSSLLVLAIFPLFLPIPPFVFTGVIWILCMVALSVMIRKTLTPWGFYTWLFFILLFVFACCSNLILRHSSFERWTMLFLSISGLAACIFLLATKKRQEIREKIILVPMVLMALFEVPAIYYNVTGGFNLAKVLMTTGIFIVVIVFLVFWTVRFLNITLRISYYFYLVSKGKKRSLSDELSNTNVPLFYYIIFFAGSFILLGRDFFYFQTVIDPFRESLTTTRTIGEFSFNYQSILIFFMVLIVSALISRVVSFLTSDNLTGSDKPRKRGLGSWLVLIRITIITAGVLIAFVAAGIPMDRFAFILGAMSVGIGFGLQSLVNNLISGVVIAFEKPVNVGDIVEFAGSTGTMKSIGIRSSVITTWDGADVIIPNGDLLNQHLVNWTLGNSRRRFDLVVQVAFDADLEKIEKLLVRLMQDDPRILKNPYPFVLASKFNSSSIELSLKFWVSHFDIGLEVKNDLIRVIGDVFREQGIKMPFPAQDIHSL